MLDDFVTLAIQHYVLTGIIALCLGILLNLVFTAGPEIVQSMRSHKLY